MSKPKMKLRSEVSDETWNEEIGHTFMWQQIDEPDPVKRAHIIIDSFNDTLRKGEQKRFIVSIKDEAGKIIWSEGDEV